MEGRTGVANSMDVASPNGGSTSSFSNERSEMEKLPLGAHCTILNCADLGTRVGRLRAKGRKFGVALEQRAGVFFDGTHDRPAF